MINNNIYIKKRNKHFHGLIFIYPQENNNNNFHSRKRPFLIILSKPKIKNKEYTNEMNYKTSFKVNIQRYKTKIECNAHNNLTHYKLQKYENLSKY